MQRRPIPFRIQEKSPTKFGPDAQKLGDLSSLDPAHSVPALAVRNMWHTPPLETPCILPIAHEPTLPSTNPSSTTGRATRTELAENDEDWPQGSFVFQVQFHVMLPCWMTAWTSRKNRGPDAIDFFIWSAEDVGNWLEDIGLGAYREIFVQNHINGEFLDKLSNFTLEEILCFMGRARMKWRDFFVMFQQLRQIKVACLQGGQEARSPWWVPCCTVKSAKRSRNVRVVSLV